VEPRVLSKGVLGSIRTEKGGFTMKETDVKLLAMLLMNQIYNDIRKIVREELERSKGEE